MRAAFYTEPVEHQTNGLLYALIRIQAEARGGGVPLVTCRWGNVQLPAPCLAEFPTMEAKAHPLLLGLAHGALEAQEQSIVRLPGRVRALFIDDHHVGQTAQIEQPMPV